MKYILIFLFLLKTISFSFLIDSIDFDEEVGGNGYREYKIYNQSMHRAIYKVKISGVGDIDITKDMSIYPNILSLDPNTYGVLKIYGGSSTNLPTGEYSFKLTFTPIVVPELKKGKEDKITGGSTIGLVPEIIMTAHVGNPKREETLDVENIQFYTKENKKLVYKMDVINNSHASITLGAQFKDRERNKGDSKRLGRVSGNSRETFEVEINNFNAGDDIVYIELYNTQKGVFINKKIK